jgi:DNA-binding MarR family transcriptional regulator
MQIPEIGRIIRALTANINSYIEKEVSKFGFGAGQFEYLILISQNEGINQNELAKLHGRYFWY